MVVFNCVVYTPFLFFFTLFSPTLIRPPSPTAAKTTGPNNNQLACEEEEEEAEGGADAP